METLSNEYHSVESDAGNGQMGRCNFSYIKDNGKNLHGNLLVHLKKPDSSRTVRQKCLLSKETDNRFLFKLLSTPFLVVTILIWRKKLYLPRFYDPP